MFVDITGTILIPGNKGVNCPGNGMNTLVECCCDECDYMQCCQSEHLQSQCAVCKDANCPHKSKSDNGA